METEFPSTLRAGEQRRPPSDLWMLKHTPEATLMSSDLLPPSELYRTAFADTAIQFVSTSQLDGDLLFGKLVP